MKKIVSLFSVLALSLSAVAQQVESYDADSISYYNGLYNPNDFAQAPVTVQQQRVKGDRLSSHIQMGTSFGSLGSSQYVSPVFNYQATNKLSLSLGLGMAYTNMKFSSLNKYSEMPAYENLKAITNYYSAAANYQASEKLQITSSVIYFQNNYIGVGEKPGFNRDAYMATFGANYQITPSFSIGFEVRQSKNISPFDYRMSPMGW